jgi:hypothetical protein
METPNFYLCTERKQKVSQVSWHTPEFPDTWEAQAEFTLVWIWPRQR